jgi:hypothetical protein
MALTVVAAVVLLALVALVVARRSGDSTSAAGSGGGQVGSTVNAPASTGATVPAGRPFTTPPAVAAPTERDAQVALLRAGDLGAGWSESPTVPTDTAAPDVCNESSSTTDVAHVGRTVSGPGGAFVNAQVFAYDGDATNALDGIMNGLSSCATYFNPVYRKDIDVVAVRAAVTRGATTTGGARLVFRKADTDTVLLLVELRIILVRGLVETLLISRHPPGPSGALVGAVTNAAVRRLATAAP